MDEAIGRISDSAVASPLRLQALRDLKTFDINYADSLDIERAVQALEAELQRSARLPARFSGACPSRSSTLASEPQEALKALGYVRRASNDTNDVSLNTLDLQGATLSQTTLRRVNFDDSCLNGLTIRDVHLIHASFKGSHLRGAVIQGLSADTVDFAHSELVGAALTGDTLRASTFRDAHLECARLINAQLVGTDFTDSYLDWTDMSQADLQGIIGWDRVRSFKNAFVADIADHNQHLIETARRGLAEADPTKHDEWAQRRDSLVRAGRICR